MKRFLLLTSFLLGAPAGLVGCGAPAVYPDIGCTTDSECKGSRICDPLARVCVSAPGTPDAGASPRTNGAFAWAKRFGDVQYDQAFATAVDSSGNVFVAGSFQGTVDFGGGPLSSVGQSDVFLAKFARDGAYQWAQRLGGAGDDLAYGLAINGSGDLVLAGAFTDVADFGGGALRSGGGYDILLASYAPDGAHRWSHGYGGPTDDSASSVAVDGSGNVVLTGYYTGQANLGGAVLPGAGGTDVFLARYNADGKHLWSRGYGGPGDDFGNRVASDSTGGVALTGFFHDRISLGGPDLTGAGGADAFVARLSADGKHLWSRGAGGQGDEGGTGVYIDASGATFVLGSYHSPVDFGGGAIAARGPSNMFLAKLGPTGAHVWSKGFPGTDQLHTSAVTGDASGVVAVGSFNDKLDLGGGALTNGGIFVARYTTDGVHQWSRRFGGNSNSDPSSATLDSSGALYVSGGFGGTVDFGAGPYQSAGDFDAFLLKLLP